MKPRYCITPRTEMPAIDLERMHALRAQVFRTRLNWSVPVTAGLEVDQYDTAAASYMLMYNSVDELCGCWRILPTTGNYMLADTFQDLLYGIPAPCDPRVFELSRFAVATDRAQGYGFSSAARAAFAEIVAWSLNAGVQELVTVTTPAIERLLVHMGIDVRRYGPPGRVDNGMAVALRIFISAKTMGAVFDRYRKTA